MSGAESTAEALAREFAALNKATERAHRAIADLRAARSELRAEREAVEELCKKVGTVTAKRAQDILEAELQRQFEPLVPQVAELLDKSRAHIARKFDDFADLLMGKDHQSGKNLEQQIREKIRVDGPPLLGVSVDWEREP